MAARKKKTVKAASKADGMAPPPNEATPISMSDEDVNEYLASVAKGDVTLDGMEADVAEKFRATSHGAQQVQQAVQEMAQRLEQGKAQSQQLAGELKGYATLLISAEDARRGTNGKPKSKTTKRPGTGDAKAAKAAAAAEA
jgi:hypothetical protein